MVVDGISDEVEMLPAAGGAVIRKLRRGWNRHKV
jgi:hypothetical protein